MSKIQELPAHLSADAAPTCSPANGAKRVLLVWDEPLAGLVLRDKLRIAGFEVEHTPNAAVALEKLPTIDPDAVILQLGIQGTEGVEFVKQARRNAEFGNRPIYVCAVCASLSTWARQTANAGPTKFFNLLATPVDTVLSDVAAQLLSEDVVTPVMPDSERRNVLAEVLSRLKHSIHHLSKELRAAADCVDNDTRAERCVAVRPEVHSLVNCAAVAGIRAMARHAAAVDAFLKELGAEPNQATAASVRTLVKAFQILDRFCTRGGQHADLDGSSELAAVLVAYPPASRVSIGNALSRAGVKPTSFAAPAEALKHLTMSTADVIAIDIQAPDVSAVAFCKQIRELPLHAKTPILLVAGPSELKQPSYASSIHGVDLMTRPFVPMELAVRALNLHNDDARDAVQEPAPAPRLKNGAEAPTMQRGRPGFATIVLAERGKIISVYQSCIDMFGWQRQELIGQNVGILLAGGLDAQLKDFLNPRAASTAAPQYSVELVARCKDGAQFPASFAVTRSAEGTRVCWSVAIRELTQAANADAATPAPVNELLSVEHGGAERTATTPGVVSAPPLQAAGNGSDTAAGAGQAARGAESDPALNFPSLLPQIHEEQQSHEHEEHVNTSIPLDEEVAPAASDHRANGSGGSAEVRCRELEEELAGLGLLCSDLLAKFTAEQVRAAEFSERVANLETNLRENATEFEKLRTDLDARAADCARITAEKEALAEEKKSLETEMARTRQDEAARTTETPGTQRRLAEAAALRTRITAELEQERADRRRTEQRANALATQLQELHAQTSQHLAAEQLSQGRIATLEQQLRERDESLARTTAELEKETAQRRSTEEQLRAASDLIAQLNACATSFDEAKTAFQRREEELLSRIEAGQAAARSAEERRDEEHRERERLDQALAEAARKLDDLSQTSSAELSKLRCALEMEQAEKKRLASEAVQLRYASADSARAALATAYDLRKETREPANNLMQATRRLLEFELGEEARKVVETVLNNALLLHATLEEKASDGADPVDPAS